ncbi:DUF3168 domain-containing protein [Sphingomonas sp. LT1P40]|uniref:DUF3168 domain-containing protein n=1 Tax=Alteristakelama amylovorans TaxID=3096166 RepID=UPI002FC9318B
MSAREMLQAGVCAALSEALDGVAVFDAPPLRGPMPHAVVEEPLLIDWSTKDIAGREGRVAVQLFDAGERPVRLRALVGLAEDAVEGIEPVLGEGWRIVTIGLVRSRIVRARDSGWMAMSEFRVRMLREN